jgi:hypothetical protein
MMIRRVLIAGVVLAAAAAAAQTLAQTLAQPRPAAGDMAVGASVVDSAGAALGRIEKVIVDSEGRPQQVLIRTEGGRSQLKSLPVASLRPRQSGFSVPLRKAEFDLLPAVRGR